MGAKGRREGGREGGREGERERGRERGGRREKDYKVTDPVRSITSM